jgi:hypothetical protein
MIAACLVAAGCVNVIHVSRPVTPPPADNGANHTSYFSHYFQLSWSGVDLADLRSLAVEHSRAIHVTSNPAVGELSVMLQVDVQPVDHETVVKDFERKVREASRLDGQDPRLVVPAHECIESANAVKKGACARELTIVVPARKALGLELSWQGQARVESLELTELVLRVPPSGGALVRRVRGNVQLRGGGPESAVRVETVMPSSEAATDIRGNLTARLSTVGRLELSAIAGKVLLFVDRPDDAFVTLDGAVIRDFPFQRP